ncbi:hypothetical protein ACOSQ3_014095 [Xanthoceras sorbifolium]
MCHWNSCLAPQAPSRVVSRAAVSEWTPPPSGGADSADKQNLQKARCQRRSFGWSNRHSKIDEWCFRRPSSPQLSPAFELSPPYKNECRSNERNYQANVVEDGDYSETLLLACNVAEDEPKNKWFLDTCCSNHMCGRKEMFSQAVWLRRMLKELLIILYH